MQVKPDYVKILFLTGCLLIVALAMVLVVASLGFFAGTGISGWQFPLAFVFAAVLYFYISKNSYRHTAIFLKSLLVSVAVIVVSIIIAVNFYDVSYDGQSYHMEGIYQLKNGWNPFTNLLPQSVNMSIYINHYSKGVEIPQSILYSLTNRIEAGKATSIILLTGAFCLTLSFLLGLNKLSASKCILLSLLAASNPVIINQLISTYVDGQLAVLLLSFLIVILMIARDANYGNLVLLAAVIIIAANVKFTGLVYMIVFTAAFLAWLLFAGKPALFKRVLYTSLISGIVAVFIVGYNPYVVNTTKYFHPFYPLMGKNQVDIMGHNMPEGFEKENAVGKFFISLFAHTDNVMRGNGKKIQLKVPFALNKIDIVNSYAIDTRIAGMGPLFSGLLLLSVISFIVFLYRSPWRSVKNQLYILGVIIVSICIVPESWWVRYIPQLWYIPLIILFIIEMYPVSQLNILKTLIYAAIIVNIGFTMLTFRYNLMMTRMVNTQMNKLKASHQTIVVQWGSAKANRIRFQENGIPFTERNLDHVPNTENIICSDSKFIVPANLSNIQK
jgi:hypothetical protein